MVYITQSGDTFDLVAYKTSRRLEEILMLNLEKMERYQFKGGVEIKLPEETAEKAEVPAWRR